MCAANEQRKMELYRQQINGNGGSLVKLNNQEKKWVWDKESF